MMRKIAIVGAFLAGLAGLCMSICGGGFFVTMAYDSARNIFQSGRPDQLIGMLLFLAIPAGFAVGGVGLATSFILYLVSPSRALQPMASVQPHGGFFGLGAAW